VVDGAVFTEISHTGTGVRNSAVMLGAGSGNVLRNVHVGQVSGGVDCSAYHWPEEANQNVGGNVWVFEDNTSEIQNDPDCHGIFVWQNDSNPHVVTNFTGDGIDHGAYGNVYHYENMDVPYVEVHAVGWSLANSTIGDVILRRHQFEGTVTFSNTTVTGAILLSDAPSGSQIQPVHLVITGNASCSQVVNVNPHPETTVTINGDDC
jgi:hypothetical protein